APLQRARQARGPRGGGARACTRGANGAGLARALCRTDRAVMTDPRSTPGGAHRAVPLARILVVWLLTSGTLLLLGALLDDVEVASLGTALVVAALLGLLNGLVWPLILRFALPLTVMTLG